MIYRLVWGMEAARVFEAAQDNPDADTLMGTAVTAIETGTFSRAASILIRSGFDHRLAAISAVMSTGAAFDSAAEMRQWISDLDPALAFSQDWPTPESRSAWETFCIPRADTALASMDPPDRGCGGRHLVRRSTGPGYLATRDRRRTGQDRDLVNWLRPAGRSSHSPQPRAPGRLACPTAPRRYRDPAALSRPRRPAPKAPKRAKR